MSHKSSLRTKNDLSKSKNVLDIDTTIYLLLFFTIKQNQTCCMTCIARKVKQTPIHFSQKNTKKKQPQKNPQTNKKQPHQKTPPKTQKNPKTQLTNQPTNQPIRR